MDDLKEIISTIDMNICELKTIKNNILLNDKEIQILNMYEIDYNNCMNMNELLFKIDMIINEEYDNTDIDDLEWVSNNISERNYYMNTNK